ncbi:MAG TPA: S8 family serine peptidase [Thermoleophilaceae bacterium]
MRIPALAVLSVLLVSLFAVAGSASAAGRDGSDYVVPGSYIVVLDESANVSRQLAEHERRDGVTARRVFRTALKGYSARLTRAQVRVLRADPQVASVEPNRIVHAADTLASGEAVPTGIARIGAASSSSGTANPASSAAVAVIDTGIDLDHPDLNVAGPGTNCVSPGSAPNDDNGHGTHVSGTIGATNAGAGVVGVAPATRVVPVKVLDSSGSGTWDQIICGINWVAAHAASDGIAVANMSLGGLGSSLDNGACGATSALHQAICNATAAGVRFAVAAGNDGWAFPHSTLPDVPAAYDEVITVTAYGDSDGLTGAAGPAPSCRSGEADDRYASFSNYSNNGTDNLHTIAAPGVCIRSTWLAGGYNTISGTSMATPHVAGATALCVSSGLCAGDTNAASLVGKLDSQTSAYGFTGDPFRPVSGRYFGYTAVAGTPSEAPSFTLTATPPNRSISRGQQATYSIGVTRTSGFTGSVAFSVSGLPNRSTASFSPASTTAAGSTLTVSTTGRTTRGTRTLTVTGTSGGRSRTVQVTLTVN